MKKWLVFLLGIITGVILTIAGLLVIGIAASKGHPDITLAEQQVPFTTSNRFEVFQVGSDGALANCEEGKYSQAMFTGPVVYILAEGQNQFYDDQVIDVPSGKQAVQIGTYRYTTRLGEKVVPVIKFL